MRRLSRLVVEAAAGALSTLTVQAIAIVVLTPNDYGRFAGVYLVFALGLSVALSTVSEPWVRVPSSTRSNWSAYSSAAMSLALTTAAGVLAWALFSGFDVASTLIFATAAGAANYRSSARFFAVVERSIRFTIPADIASAVSSIVVWFVASEHTNPVTSLAMAWLSGALISVALSRYPSLPSARGLRQWFVRHSDGTRALLIDSSLLDLSTTILPLAIAPTLGATQFGLYRGVMSLTAPVRILLLPVRPLISRRDRLWHSSWRTLLSVASLGCLLGALAWFGLGLVAQSSPLVGTAIQQTAALFQAPTAILLATLFMGTYFYYVNRNFSAPRMLISLRLFQLGATATLALGGLIAFGLEGLIWGTVAASAAQAVALMVSARFGQETAS